MTNEKRMKKTNRTKWNHCCCCCLIMISCGDSIKFSLSENKKIPSIYFLMLVQSRRKWNYERWFQVRGCVEQAVTHFKFFGGCSCLKLWVWQSSLTQPCITLHRIFTTGAFRTAKSRSVHSNFLHPFIHIITTTAQVSKSIIEIKLCAVYYRKKWQVVINAQRCNGRLFSFPSASAKLFPRNHTQIFSIGNQSTSNERFLKGSPYIWISREIKQLKINDSW